MFKNLQELYLEDKSSFLFLMMIGAMISAITLFSNDVVDLLIDKPEQNISIKNNNIEFIASEFISSFGMTVKKSVCVSNFRYESSSIVTTQEPNDLMITYYLKCSNDPYCKFIMVEK